jgi:hypothetical protein
LTGIVEGNWLDEQLDTTTPGGPLTSVAVV